MDTHSAIHVLVDVVKSRGDGPSDGDAFARGGSARWEQALSTSPATRVLAALTGLAVEAIADRIRRSGDLSDPEVGHVIRSLRSADAGSLCGGDSAIARFRKAVIAAISGTVDHEESRALLEWSRWIEGSGSSVPPSGSGIDESWRRMRSRRSPSLDRELPLLQAVRQNPNEAIEILQWNGSHLR